MIQLDMMKELKDLYTAFPERIFFTTIPSLNYLMIDGEGDPNVSQLYKDSVQALYSVAYTIKFSLKKSSQAIDFKVMPLEGLWWVEDMNLFSIENKKDWKWTMMILQPECVTSDWVNDCKNSVIKKKGLQLANEVRFETYHEKEVTQILHKGPYSTEAENIQKLHKTITDWGYLRTGKHHEIYLNTPLKTAPEKLKTIIRQPIQKKK
jgi:hypothetical protein